MLRGADVLAQRAKAAKRKSQPSEQKAAVRERNKKRKEREDQGLITKPYNLSIRGSEKQLEEFKTTLTDVCIRMGEPGGKKATQREAISRALDFWMQANHDEDAHRLDVDTGGPGLPFRPRNGFSVVSPVTKDEPMFLATETAINHLSVQLQEHARACGEQLIVPKGGVRMIGHMGKVSLKCIAKHSVEWDSSPHFYQKHLVNYRMAHAYFSSGIRPIQYKKICDAAGMGNIEEKTLRSHYQKVYSEVVSEFAEESTALALKEETGIQVMVDGDDFAGISVMSDARHCWRKNAFFSDVAFLGDRTHRVIKVITVSRDEEQYSQNHELLGTQKFYDWADANAVNILVHAHDNNKSINKLVVDRAARGHRTVNGNDTWHATKGIARAMKGITTGPKYKEGVSWHPELTDKAASVKTHVYWAMKNCALDAGRLRGYIDNTINHYKGDHTGCHHTSTCQVEGDDYRPRKVPIEDPKAEKLLRDFLRGTVVYKNAENYVHAKDTHYVESFNNALLIYHDKRICFGKESYLLRINLAILDWNENVDRDHTSEWRCEDAAAPRRREPKKQLVEKKYIFRKKVWEEFMRRIYTPNMV
ncbi:Hypp6578 [Branchiostoma lanceolatum]|uniref:Hypp6578 protein n=1 Tax=Branchiostoma lanceolatum TaxID=7740 RepID=A0A8K0EAE2_BRALA|nr:Hypp6578 [Branchiostoma lanceolatum]